MNVLWCDRFRLRKVSQCRIALINERPHRLREFYPFGGNQSRESPVQITGVPLAQDNDGDSDLACSYMQEGPIRLLYRRSEELESAMGFSFLKSSEIH